MTERTEKIAFGVFVFSLTSIIILMIYSGSISLTGNVVANEDNNLYRCDDSDGLNYDLVGSVNYCVGESCEVKIDSCSGKILTERYCESNKLKSLERNCEFDCVYGACVEKAERFVSSKGISGGSGGYSSSADSSYSSQQVYNLGILSAEKIVEVGRGEVIQFIISEVDYSINIIDASPTALTITFSSGDLTISVGSTEQIDLMGDGSAIINLRVKSVNTISNRAKLILSI